MTTCSKCGGPLTMIAAPSASSGQASKIPPVIQRILAHLGLPTRAPPRAPAKADLLFQPA